MIEISVNESINGALRNITVSTISSSSTASEIDGEYPDVARVIPRECNGKPATFDCDLLADVKKAFSLISDVNNCMPTWHFNGPSGPSVFTSAKCPGVLAVVMPLRLGDKMDSAAELQAALA